MIRNLIMSGGPAHDYDRTSSILSRSLAQVDIDSEIRQDFSVLEDGGLLDFDMLTLNCARWTCEDNPDWRDEWHFELRRSAQEVLLNYLAQGKGILALHSAVICFDDWREYRSVLGAWWEWGHSTHPPMQEHEMRVRTNAHRVVRDVEDFVITDELYIDLRTADTLDPLVEAEWEGRTFPVLWQRQYGNARIFYNGLGHGVEAFEHPVFKTLVQRGALWVAGQLA